MKPKASIILTTYNRAGMLPSALESVCSQTFKDWELIVIDDGSTDHTAQILREFSAREPRMRVHSQTNSGMGISRAKGLNLAQGMYAAFLDDDDIFFPEKLSKQVEFLDSHPEIDLVYSQVKVIGEKSPLPEIWPVKASTDFESLIKLNTIQPNAVLMKRNVLERFGNFNSKLKSCDDYELWLRIAYSGKIAFLPEVVGTYHWHPANISRNTRKRSLSNFKIYQSFLKQPISSEAKQMIRRQVGLKNYMQASDALEQKRFESAHYHFKCALLIDPAIGLSVEWNKTAPGVYRFLRPYLGWGYSFLKSSFTK